MKKDKSDKKYLLPLGIPQRGGLLIKLGTLEILEELTLIQKIIFLLGLRHFTSTDDIEIRIKKLGTRIAHDEIFGYEPDFGKALFTDLPPFYSSLTRLDPSC